MHFESAGRSVVRSVRQSDLLSVWLRLFRREQALPLVHQYRPDHLEDEKPDLMYYDIRHEGDAFRFLVQHGGQNLVSAFGTGKGEGKFLDELVDAERLASIIPCFVASIEARRPIYTVSTVTDISGVPVRYERLVLPFGADHNVQHLIVSLKTISTEGRFETKDLMRRDKRGPTYVVCAVIDQDAEPVRSRLTVADDVVEV